MLLKRDHGRPQGSAIAAGLLLLGCLLGGLTACDSRRSPAPPPSETSDTAPSPPAQETAAETPQKSESSQATGNSAAAASADATSAPSEASTAPPPSRSKNTHRKSSRHRPRAAAPLEQPPPDISIPSEPKPAKKPPAEPQGAEKAVDQLKKAPGTPEAPVQSDGDAQGGRELPPSPSANPCERPDVDDTPVIDDTRQLLEEQTCNAALWMDGLFADHGDENAAKRTRGFLELTNTYSQFGGFNSRSRLHVEYDLPTLQNRLSAFVGREDDEDFVRGRTENAELRSTFPALGNDNKWLAGLGYSLPGTKNLQTQFNVGVRGLGPPTAFVQGRLRYTLYSDDDDVAYIRTTPFWNTRDGFGITQSFDYSHVLSHRHVVRWYTVGTISERTVGLNWRNSLILYQNLQHKRGLAYEAFIRGETDNPEPLYEYGARVLLRHPFLKQKLFLEWSTGYSFPRDDPEEPRNGSYNIGLSIELPFGTLDDDGP